MRLYRLLLKLYPARFREEYAGPLERQFLDECRDAGGSWARTRLWGHALWDLAVSVPRELTRELSQDVRFSARIYRRRKLVTILALAALALGIGATTGIFSVLNALLLRGLPFRDPERLVEMWRTPLTAFQGRAGFYSGRERAPYLEDAATFISSQMTLYRNGESARVRVTETSANLFALLGTEPRFGRGFAPEEDASGADGVAMISYAMWQQLFGGDPRVLGSAIRLNGTVMTVIGVAPARFDYPGNTEIWTPTAFDLQKMSKPGAVFSETIGRLRPGTSLALARNLFEAEIRRTRPDDLKLKGVNRAALTPLRDQLAGPVRRASLVLLAAVVFVLLIACANVAQLLLARVTERRREMAVRAALGASRARLVQQLITEATVLTMAAAAAGLLVAEWASRLAASVQPAPLASQAYTIIDGRVLGFAMAVALATGLIFGVLPAASMGGARPARVRMFLIGLQAALAVILIAGTAIMGRSFLKLVGADLGFQTGNVVTLNVSLAGSGYEGGGRQAQYYHGALDRLRAVPGIEAAGAVQYLPLIRYSIYPGSGFRLDSGQELAFAVPIAASSGYFRAMGTEVIAGRDFSAGDRQGSDAVAIVSEDLARSTGLGAAIVGRSLTSGFPRAVRTVVGVVRAAKFSGPAIYLPMDQYAPGFVTFVARVRGEVAPYLPVCRDAVQQIDREIPVYDVKTLDQRLSDYVARPRFYTQTMAFFAAFALLLAVIGIYGVASHWIAQRSQEIGVRIAVGASHGVLRGMLLRQSLWPIAAGVTMGVAAASVLGSYLERLIQPAEPLDAWTCAGAALMLLVTAAVAVWTASARILRIDPVSALRAE